MVSQRDILPEIQHCLRGLSANERSRVWSHMMNRLNLSMIDHEFEESWRQKIAAQLALTATGSVMALSPKTWPHRQRYEMIRSHLEVLARDGLEGSPSLEGV